MLSNFDGGTTTLSTYARVWVKLRLNLTSFRVALHVGTGASRQASTVLKDAIPCGVEVLKVSLPVHVVIAEDSLTLFRRRIPSNASNLRSIGTTVSGVS